MCLESKGGRSQKAHLLKILAISTTFIKMGQCSGNETWLSIPAKNACPVVKIAWLSCLFFIYCPRSLNLVLYWFSYRQLPGPPISSETESSKNSWPDSYPSPAMPSIFETRLKNICPHCPGKGRTAWRNIHRPDSHFDTSFRFVDETENRETRCFLTRESLPNW